jgi:hypothetical protein
MEETDTICSSERTPRSLRVRWVSVLGHHQLRWHQGERPNLRDDHDERVSVEDPRPSWRSPILGAGLYVNQDFGAAGSTGPAQHFFARSPIDPNRALWGGFTLVADGAHVFFDGDTSSAPSSTMSDSGSVRSIWHFRPSALASRAG